MNKIVSRQIHYFFTLLLSLWVMNTAYASSSYQDLNSIKTAAEQFLYENIDVEDDETLEIKVGHLDSRLQLSACEQPLFVSDSAHQPSARTRTLLVKCQDNKPWQIYLSAKVILMKPVVVARSTLSKGDSLDSSKLEIRERDVNRLRGGYFTDLSELDGKAMRLSLRSGQVLTRHNVTSPKIIKRGQQVDLLAVGPGIEVHQRGQAMKDGAEGDFIPVKNLTSKRIIEGQVTRNGSVKILI